jgi:hypothetical protein
MLMSLLDGAGIRWLLPKLLLRAPSVSLKLTTPRSWHPNVTHDCRCLSARRDRFQMPVLITAVLPDHHSLERRLDMVAYVRHLLGRAPAR